MEDMNLFSVQKSIHVPISLHHVEKMLTIWAHHRSQIDAIKYMRTQYGLSLKEAKNFTDAWRTIIYAIAGVQIPGQSVNLGQLLRAKIEEVERRAHGDNL